MSTFVDEKPVVGSGFAPNPLTVPLAPGPMSPVKDIPPPKPPAPEPVETVRQPVRRRRKPAPRRQSRLTDADGARRRRTPMELRFVWACLAALLAVLLVTAVAGFVCAASMPAPRPPCGG